MSHPWMVTLTLIPKLFDWMISSPRIVNSGAILMWGVVGASPVWGVTDVLIFPYFDLIKRILPSVSLYNHNVPRLILYPVITSTTR
jgi:hypothetical protein